MTLRSELTDEQWAELRLSLLDVALAQLDLDGDHPDARAGLHHIIHFFRPGFVDEIKLSIRTPERRQ